MVNKIKWNAEVRMLKNIQADGRKYKKMDVKMERKLQKSLEEFDMAKPLVINLDGKIIDGNFRYKLLLENNSSDTITNVMIPNRQLTNDEVVKLAIKLNTIRGDYDLEELLESVDSTILLDSGLEDELLKFEEECLETEDDEFDTEKELSKIQENVVAKLGDIYKIKGNGFQGILGCGDSGDSVFFQKVRGNTKVDIVISDPNFNIGIDYDKGFGKKSNYGGVVNDSRSDKDYEDFIEKNIKNVMSAINNDAHIMYFHDSKYTGMFQRLFETNGIRFQRLLLWLKGGFNPTPNCAFNRFHEPIVYGIVNKPYIADTHKNLTEVLNKEISTGGQSLDDVLDMIDVLLAKKLSGYEMEHSTQKPVTLYERPLKRCSKVGQTMLDTFAGSGSSLIACAQLKRNFIAFDINPVFIDLIIRRLESLGNVKITKIN